MPDVVVKSESEGGDQATAFAAGVATATAAQARQESEEAGQVAEAAVEAAEGAGASAAAAQETAWDARARYDGLAGEVSSLRALIENRLPARTEETPAELAEVAPAPEVKEETPVEAPKDGEKPAKQGRERKPSRWFGG